MEIQVRGLSCTKNVGLCQQEIIHLENSYLDASPFFKKSPEWIKNRTKQRKTWNTEKELYQNKKILKISQRKGGQGKVL